MSNPLLDKIRKAGTVKTAEILSKSVYITNQTTIHTDLPILNIAFSGDLNGGLTSGVTILSGVSRSFKSLLGLYSMKAYLDNYDDAIALFYDSEFGTPPKYMSTMGIDTNRVIHIPVTNIDELKFDMVSRLEQIERGNKCFVFIDSLGNLASKREYENAVKENAAKDMSRAQDVKSFFRIVTPHIVMKDLPCVIVNHVYQEMGLFPKAVVAGGSGVMYSANTVFIITKSQEKEGTDIIGWNYNINIEKSRYVKEKSKLSFQVLYNSGISKYSGLLDIALESGHIIKPSNGWYSRVINGEPEQKKYRLKEINTDEFWSPILDNESFNEYVKKKFQLGESQLQEPHLEIKGEDDGE